MSRRPSAEISEASEAIGVAALQTAIVCPVDCAVPLVDEPLVVKRIVDVFVKDTLKGSYPVVIECQRHPTEDEFVDQVRNGMDRGFYSADDIKVAKFVVR